MIALVEIAVVCVRLLAIGAAHIEAPATLTSLPANKLDVAMLTTALSSNSRGFAFWIANSLERISG